MATGGYQGTPGPTDARLDRLEATLTRLEERIAQLEGALIRLTERVAQGSTAGGGYQGTPAS